MSGIRGSLQELVARLAALDEQREALRAVIAQRLGLAGAPRIAQATQPRVAPGRVPHESQVPRDKRALPGVREAQILALARTRGGILGIAGVAKACGLDPKSASSQLNKMAKRGQLRHLGPGRYALPGKTAPGPRPGSPSRQVASPGQRVKEILALATDLAKQGESVTSPRVAAALGIAANHAHVTLSQLATKGKLQRVSPGIYVLPGGTPSEEPTSSKDTDQTVALAIRNGGIVDIAAILAAGIKSKHALAAVMLRKLHARGRLERVAPETYATPDKAAQMRTLRKMDRAADKRAEETP